VAPVSRESYEVEGAPGPSLLGTGEGGETDWAGAPGPSLLGTGEGGETDWAGAPGPRENSKTTLRVPPVPRFWGPGRVVRRTGRVAPVPVRIPKPR